MLEHSLVIGVLTATLAALLLFSLYCALVVASREDDRLENRNESPENRNDPPKGEDDRLEKWDTDPPRAGHRQAKTGHPEKGRARKFKNTRRELPPPPRYGDEDRKN